MATEQDLNQLRNAIAEAEALATAVGIKTDNQSILDSGGQIVLNIDPRAQSSATSADAYENSFALSHSFGLGTGRSHFYDNNDVTVPYYHYESHGLNSLDLQTLLGANGSINGLSEAIAKTTSSNDATTEAVAVNIGLGNLDLESVDSSTINIGTEQNPFEARALATSASNAADVCGCYYGTFSKLKATAIARGIENQLEGNTKTILGQPVANVAATAHIAPLTTNSAVQGRALADAVALQGVNLTTTPNGNGNGLATVVGNATATTGMKGVVPKDLAVPGPHEPALTFFGSAIGIDAGTVDLVGSIEGNMGAKNYIKGSANTVLDVQDDEYLVNSHVFDEECIETDLTAIGIRNADITTGSKDDQIIGTAGIQTGEAILQEDTSDLDLAAIRNTDIRTGLGNDVVVGEITSLPKADVFDTTTSKLAFNGFEGGTKNATVDKDPDINQANTVSTGIGNDSISGTGARDYIFEGGIGNDHIDLDNAWNTQLIGGLGNDKLIANGTTENLMLFGDIGRDYLEGGYGDGGHFSGNDYIDGGAGIDVSRGNGGSDTFVYSYGPGALNGTADQYINNELLDEESWSTLSVADKNMILGETERILDFTSGTESSGDVLQLSSSLATITSEQWHAEGVIMTAAQAENPLYANRIGVVVDSLDNIQQMGSNTRNYAIAVNQDGTNGMVIFDADGNFKDGAQVVTHLADSNGNLGGIVRDNVSFA
jgi:hypothetical protein